MKMKKQLLFLVFFFLIFLRPSFGACVCDIEGGPFFQGEQITMGCYCTAQQEKNKAYTMTWYNTTGDAQEIDIGVTPSSVLEYFYETHLIPSDADLGIWTANLTVDSIYKTDEDFNVTNSTLLDEMFLVGEAYDKTIDLGTIVSGSAKLKHLLYGYVTNARCDISILSPTRIPLDTKTTSTTGGDGHILEIFDTVDWNRHTCCANDLEGKQLIWYVECICYANCTSNTDGAGCCIGSDNKALITQYLHLDRELPITVNENHTPMDGFGRLSLTLYVIMYFTILFILGKTWDIMIFQKQNLNNPNNLMKVMMIWLGIWMLLIPLQHMNLIIDHSYANDKVVTLFETLYTVHTWLAYILSAFMLIFFINNILLYLGVDIIKTFRGNR